MTKVDVILKNGDLISGELLWPYDCDMATEKGRACAVRQANKNVVYFSGGNVLYLVRIENGG